MEETAAYQAALDYIYSFIDYSMTRALRYSPEKFDLGRMSALLELMGNPQRSYPVLHVAGTKGKGSVAALIASSLRAAGYRTGLYTSPHLQEYVERMQIDGQAVSADEFVELVEAIKPWVQKVEHLTTFEITTALAFEFFHRHQVDVAVIEVGLGGRLDATNVVDPLVSVITSLSMDHMAVLGDTLEKIAAEKAGIIKPNRPVVTSPQREEALKVIEDTALRRGAALIEVSRDYRYQALSHSFDGQSFLVWRADEQSQMDAYREHNARSGWEPTRLSLPLLGKHQIDNAVTAFVALQAARQAGLQISDEAIRKGFAEVEWPGRFEVMSREPLLIVDSAHNPDSAAKLRQALDDYLPGIPVTLLFGASEDKDVLGMFQELIPRVERVIATQSVHPRAMEAEKIVELAQRLGCPAKAVLPFEVALQTALSEAGGRSAVIAAGSLFIAAAARHAWLVQADQHRPSRS